MAWLPTATYFRDHSIFHDGMNWKDEITGLYTFIRRMIRLEAGNEA